MAVVYISEYSHVASVDSPRGPNGIAAQAPQEPALASQTVAITGSTTQSSAFNRDTTLLRVHADAVCSIEIGSNPTATTSSKRLAAGQTEYFGVKSGMKLAVISNV